MTLLGVSVQPAGPPTISWRRARARCSLSQAEGWNGGFPHHDPGSASAGGPLTAILELRRRLQLILGRVHGRAPDLVAGVVLDRHRVGINRDIVGSHTEESADRKNIAGDLLRAVESDVLDLADVVVLLVVDVEPDDVRAPACRCSAGSSRLCSIRPRGDSWSASNQGKPEIENTPSAIKTRMSRAADCHAFSENTLKLYRDAQRALIRLANASNRPFAALQGRSDERAERARKRA